MPGRSHPPLFDLLERSRAPSEVSAEASSRTSTEPDAPVEVTAPAEAKAKTTPPEPKTDGPAQANAPVSAAEPRPIADPRTAGPRPAPSPASVTAPARSAAQGGPAVASRPAPARPADSGEWRVPKSWVYGAGIALVIVVLVVWSLGVNYGESRAEARYATQLTGQRLTPTEPSQSAAAASESVPESLPSRSAPAANGGAAVPADGAPTRPSGITTDADRPPTLFTADGAIASDPRLEGYNYLKLVSNVPMQQAAGVAVFLADRGVQVLAVATTPVDRASPVDRTASGANNAVRYDLFSLRGIASERYSSSADERREHQRTLQRLGRAWLERPEGLINFDQTFWTKYQP